MKTRKKKPPRPPREICGSFINWLFGIVSPSLVHTVETEKTRAYWRELYEFYKKDDEGGENEK